MKHFPFQPEPIELITVDGRPFRVVVKKRLQNVVAISNLWRIDDGWWIKPVNRLYYTLELESGSRITVFRNLSDNKWYTQHWTT